MQQSQFKYDLHLTPLRYDPELTFKVVEGVRHTLATILDDPFAVRDVIVAIREVVDNMVTHADWSHACRPTFRLFYDDRDRHEPAFSLVSTNGATDLKEAASRANEIVANTDSESAKAALLARLHRVPSEEGSRPPSGGIGLLQIIASPRCHVSTKVEGERFVTRVDIAVPEIAAPRSQPSPA